MGLEDEIVEEDEGNVQLEDQIRFDHMNLLYLSIRWTIIREV